MLTLKALGHVPHMAIIENENKQLMWRTYGDGYMVPAILTPEQEQYIRTPTRRGPLYFETLDLPAPVNFVYYDVKVYPRNEVFPDMESLVAFIEQDAKKYQEKQDRVYLKRIQSMRPEMIEQLVAGAKFDSTGGVASAVESLSGLPIGDMETDTLLAAVVAGIPKKATTDQRRRAFEKLRPQIEKGHIEFGDGVLDKIAKELNVSIRPQHQRLKLNDCSPN